VVLEKRTPEPLADIGALAYPPVLMTNIATLLVGFAMFGSFILIPQLADAPASTGYGLGSSATGGGLLLVPGSMLMLFLGPFSGILGSRLGNKVPLAIGGFLTAAGLALLAASHGTRLEVIAFSTVMCAGIGFAYAAMPNLIIEAVPPHQTGEATGFNALIRSVGGSLGSQIAATVLASSAIAGVPTDAGYTDAFAISAAVGVCAGVVALLIPRARRHYHAPVLEEVGAAAPLPEPAYASEDFSHGR
jgi:MFS family permease